MSHRTIRLRLALAAIEFADAKSREAATVEALLTTAETRGVSPWEAAVASGEVREEPSR